jgi:UPF0271 protein
MMRQILLNADLGEGSPNDNALMRIVGAANIACGGHAGDSQSMAVTVHSAIANNTKIGAHPSYPDRDNFGRQAMNLSPDALHNSIAEQLLALNTIVTAQGEKIHHIKPHGALYNLAAVNNDIAHIIIEACLAFDPSTIVIAPPDSVLKRIAQANNISVLTEGFADRRYQPDGQLLPRNAAGAVINNVDDALQQVKQIIQTDSVTTACNQRIALKIDTLCVHGDHHQALELALQISELYSAK